MQIHLPHRQNERKNDLHIAKICMPQKCKSISNAERRCWSFDIVESEKRGIERRSRTKHRAREDCRKGSSSGRKSSNYHERGDDRDLNFKLQFSRNREWIECRRYFYCGYAVFPHCFSSRIECTNVLYFFLFFLASSDTYYTDK